MKKRGRRLFGINTQMAGGMIVLILLLVALIYLLNRLYLSGFYLRKKEDELVDAFTTINTAAGEGSLYDDAYIYTIEQMCSTANLSVMIVSSDSEILIASQNENDVMLSQLFDALFQRNISSEEIIRSTEDYTMQRQTDSRMNNEYLILSGTLSDGNLILIRSAIASMEDAARMANELLLYAAIAVGVIGIIYAAIFTRRLLRPLHRLDAVADEMAKLNLEARYEPQRHPNELDDIGMHFNELSERLEAAIGELKQANADLEADLRIRKENERMRKEFLSNVSHELKTPLSLVLGYAEGLKEGVTDDGDTREQYLEVIIDEAQRMDQLVRELLTLNELEFNASDLHMERFDITEMIVGILSANSLRFEQEGIVAGTTAQSPVYVWGDVFRVEQVLNNYLSNAIHHAENEKHIEIRCEERDAHIRVHVFNSGRPIEEEKQSFVWDKFYRTDEARSRAYGGSGIGLSIVKAIMEGMGQAYGLSNFDNGVDFWFELEK